jgi:N-acyl homoserine lactone hydrolase
VRKSVRLLMSAFCLAMLGGAAPPPRPLVELWRLDCGSIWVADLDQYSDTRAYVGRHRRFAVSCYLIRHGADYMLWDTGLPRFFLGKPLNQGKEEAATLRTTLVDQLRTIGVEPERVSILALSHLHFDHTGQAGDFPAARLLIGKPDLERLRHPGERPVEGGEAVAHWTTGNGVAEGVSGDQDLFGDGRVVMLDLPGHTPGHHGLLVQLDRTGPVLLSGDVAHLEENLQTGGVPSFNASRADSLASMDRFRTLARNLHAVAILGHEESEISRLPAYPESAK